MMYTEHTVAVLLAETIGDDCACNINSNDEWLPFCCDYRDDTNICPNAPGVTCWEQYLKHRLEKEKILEENP